MFISRKELASLGVVMTDDQWKDFCRLQDDLSEKTWNEEHPLDD